MSDVRLIDANALKEEFIGNGLTLTMAHIKMIIDKAPTIEFNETIALDFTNITEEQKQELIKLLSKTRIQAIDKDVIWQNGYDTCLNDKSIRESNWIPVSERLPDNETEVLFQYQYGQSMMVGYHMFDFTVYPSGFEDQDETGWYDRNDNYICGDDEVIAWQPLPEPYKETENERIYS